MKKNLLIALLGITPLTHACTMEFINDCHDKNYELQHKGPITLASHKEHKQSSRNGFHRSYILHSQTNGDVTEIKPGGSYVYDEKRLLKGKDEQYGDKLIYLKAGEKMCRVQMVKCFSKPKDPPQKIYLSQIELMANNEQALDPDPDPRDSGVINDYLTVSVEE